MSYDELWSLLIRSTRYAAPAIAPCLCSQKSLTWTAKSIFVSLEIQRKSLCVQNILLAQFISKRLNLTSRRQSQIEQPNLYIVSYDQLWSLLIRWSIRYATPAIAPCLCSQKSLTWTGKNIFVSLEIQRKSLCVLLSKSIRLSADSFLNCQACETRDLRMPAQSKESHLNGRRHLVHQKKPAVPVRTKQTFYSANHPLVR